LHDFPDLCCQRLVNYSLALVVPSGTRGSQQYRTTGKRDPVRSLSRAYRGFLVGGRLSSLFWPDRRGVRV